MAVRRRKSELETLRDLVRAKHKAATDKAARLRKKGIEIAGTNYDIRRDISRVKSYNMAQLNAYLYELMGFNSRKTQFVAGASGQPISTADWRRYKDVERRVNEIGRRHDASVGNIHIDFSGMTIAEREKMLSPLAKFDRDTPRPYTQLDRKARNIEGPQALEQLRKQLEKKLDKKRTISKSIGQTKRNFKKILKEMGASDLMQKVNQLSTHQADILFNYTPLADIIALGYGDWKEYRSGGKQSDMDAVVNEQRGDVLEILDWAAKLPRK